MKFRSLAVVAAATALAVAPTAQAATSTNEVVTGTTVGASLAVGAGVSSATFGAALDSTATQVNALTAGVLPIVAVGPWVVRTSSANGGKFTKVDATACPNGTTTLGNPLRIWTGIDLAGGGVSANYTAGSYNSAAISTSNPLPLSSTSTQLASGTGTNVLAVNFRWLPATTDQLDAGCAYTETTTLDLASS
jgi:hypothetical protein